MPEKNEHPPHSSSSLVSPVQQQSPLDFGGFNVHAEGEGEPGMPWNSSYLLAMPSAGGLSPGWWTAMTEEAISGGDGDDPHLFMDHRNS